MVVIQQPAARSCAGRWWLLHHCRWCATTLAVTTWKEPVRQQWPASCVLAATAATAVQPARLLTGGGTGRAARPWRQQGWCATDTTLKVNRQADTSHDV
jgi:hypothetical protein